MFIYFERERESVPSGAGEGQRERERESQAGCTLSAEPNRGGSISSSLRIMT